MSQGTKRPLAEVRVIADQIVTRMSDACERIEIAGSIRRKKPIVGDIEIVFIPRMEAAVTEDFFAPAPMISATDRRLDEMLAGCEIERRLNTLGHPVWGRAIKHAIHSRSGIGLDLFATTAERWHNYMVCRTGPMESNKRIAAMALKRGWKWHPTETGFERTAGEDAGRIVAMTSEREVFEFVGLPYRQPEARNE